MPTPRRPWTNTRLAAVSLLLTLTVFGAFLLLVGRQVAREYLTSRFSFTGDYFTVPDADAGYVAVADGRTTHRVEGRSYDVFTDSRGIRVVGAGVDTPDTVDVVTIGCSFSWGDGVPADVTFTARLQDTLGITGANLALAGYGTVQATQMLSRHAAVRPRVVIYGFIDAHLARNLNPCAPSLAPFCRAVPYVAFDAADVPSLHPPEQDAWSSESRSRRVLTLAGRQPGWRDAAFGAEMFLYRAYRRLRFRYDDTPERRSAALRLAMANLGDMATRLGAKLVVLHIPDLSHPAPDGAPDMLRSALPPAAVLVDAAPAVAEWHRRHPQVPLTNSPTDLHPNATAHELMASVLAPVLKGLVR